jgi:ankyrin repeat protein
MVEDVCSAREALPNSQGVTCTLRIVYERTFDIRLAAAALPHALLYFEETMDIGSYKEALAMALLLNIAIDNADRRPREPDERFNMLNNLAIAVDQLIRGERQINEPDNMMGRTILHDACAAGAAEVLESLFWRGACFNKLSLGQVTPLANAIGSGDLDTIRFSLALGSDPTRNLYNACQSKRKDIASLLLEYGANIYHTVDGLTLLHKAVLCQSTDEVRFLLTLGADSNMDFPLYNAWFTGNREIMTLLVEHGADIDQIHQDRTLLQRAVQKESLDEVGYMLSLGADPNLADPISGAIAKCIIWDCYSCRHEEIACLLVEEGARTSIEYDTGQSLVHFAARKAHIRLLRLVLAQGVSPGTLAMRDRHGKSALHRAAETSTKVRHLKTTLDVVSALLDAGAFIDALSDEGCSALCVAASDGCEDLVQLLLNAGADVEIRNMDGDSALTLASRKGHTEVVQLLLSAGAVVKPSNSGQQSALSHAVRFGHRAIVRQLLQRAPPSSNDTHYVASAVQYAFDEHHEDIVQDLLMTMPYPRAAWDYAIRMGKRKWSDIA